MRIRKYRIQIRHFLQISNNENRKELLCRKKFLMTVSEIMEELGVSKSFAYKLMQKMNKELENKGFIVINGKVSRKYFEEQFYGMAETSQNGG